MEEIQNPRPVVEAGERAVLEHIKAEFKTRQTKSYTYTCQAGCGVCWPPINQAFELVEPIEYWTDPWGRGVRTLPPGIYRISFLMPGGNTCHRSLIEQRNDEGVWVRRGGLDLGWSTGPMLDWRAARKFDEQPELPLT